MYFKYCILLGTVKNHPERIQRPSYLLREDVLKLDRYIAKAKLLIDNKIETVADLQAYLKGLQESVAQLTAERQDLRNTLKRAERAEDEPARRACTAQIKQISASIRKVRKDIRLCDEIESSSAQISENLRKTKEESNMETPQRHFNSSGRRSISRL